MTWVEQLIYGSDRGVPCTTDATMQANIEALLGFKELSESEIQSIGGKALALFPATAARINRELKQHARV